MPKITELGPLTGAAAALVDLLETVDVSDTSMAASGTNKKLALSDLIAFLNASSYDAAFANKWTKWTGNQAAYDAIVTKDPNTLYVIV